MLIARSPSESDSFIEQEQSHVCVFEQPNRNYFVDDEHYCIGSDSMFKFPERIKRIRTKKYGTLAFFDSVSELLNSKFNKGVIVGYCSSVCQKKSKRTMINCCDISTYTNMMTIEDKEFSPSGGLYMNNIEGVEPQNAFLFVVERNKFCNNEIQFIDNFKLKTKN